jgi:hypothetical protein
MVEWYLMFEAEQSHWVSSSKFRSSISAFRADLGSWELAQRLVEKEKEIEAAGMSLISMQNGSLPPLCCL